MPPKRKTPAASKADFEPEVVAETVEAPQQDTAAEAAAPTPESPEAAAAVAAAAAAAAIAAPAPTIVVAGSPTEMYAQLQAVVAQDPSRINDHVGPLLELMHAAEDPSSPILLRVRFLEFVGKNVANLRDNAALKKIVTSLVKIIGGEDNTPQLMIAAIQCFPGLGPVSMLDKSWEYLSREGADILMQVIIDQEAFAETVRHAARKALDALTASAFRSVATKLIHWLSDDREGDDEEQLRKERQLALGTLTRFSMSGSMKAHWTEDTQTYVLSLIYQILGVVDVREFAQLARVAANMPIVRAKSGLPLLETFLSNNRLDSERSIEAVTIIGRYLHITGKRADGTGEAVEFDLVAPLESAGQLGAGSIDGASHKAMLIARAVLLAARLAPADVAERLLSVIASTVLQLVGNDGTALPENLTTLEEMLFAMAAIAAKKPAEALLKFNEDDFHAAMTALAAAAAAVQPQLTFTIKKQVREDKAGNDEAEALACVHNVSVLARAFATKQVPTGEHKGSWTGLCKLPALKRAREAGRSALPAARGTAGASDRPRHGGSGGRGRDGDRKRSNSDGPQPNKRQRTASSSSNKGSSAGVLDQAKMRSGNSHGSSSRGGQRRRR